MLRYTEEGLGTSPPVTLLGIYLEVDGKDLGLPLQYIYLICCGGGRQASLTVKTFLEVTASWGWVDEVCYQRDMSGGCDRLLH